MSKQQKIWQNKLLLTELKVYFLSSIKVNGEMTDNHNFLNGMTNQNQRILMVFLNMRLKMYLEKYQRKLD